MLEGLEQRRLLVGPSIDHVDPLGNSHTAPVDTDVSAIYDQDIHPASVSDATFAVHAMQSGQLLEPENVFSVDGSTICLDPDAEFNPGELVRAKLAVEAPKLGDAHVFRVRLLSPEGKELAPVTANLLAVKGKAVWEVPIAVSDPKGEYTLEARDVATGAKASHKLTVE